MMVGSLRFDGRAAIVTGAGGGLGKCYALLLAARGAQVVVNDLGGSNSGEGKSQMSADLVVNEIISKGGKAVANYDSVEEGEKIVKTCLDSFGRVDILVNNAGILRDRSVLKTGDIDWDLVHRVHLRGSFITTRAAWPHMKKQNFGRVVMTSSVAGLYGNFGQANYSAAKMGLVGLCNTLAIEGKKNNIFCNVIVPMAASRLTKDILPPDLFESLDPALIAPVVSWLCHEDCQDSGNIIESAAGWAGKYRWQRSRGAILRKNLNEEVLPETVRDKWTQIMDMENGDYPQSNQEATASLIERMAELQEEKLLPPSNVLAGSNGIQREIALSHESKPFDFTYDERDVILYALGVGASLADENGIQFLYEGHPDFKPLPSFAVIPSFSALGSLTDVPGLNIDPSKILHGEQKIEILKPLQSAGTLRSTFQIMDILDKKSGALLIVDVISKDHEDEVIVKNRLSIFVVGAGGFGGPRTSQHSINNEEPPNRDCDCSMEYKTNIDQAALYRLSGDKNPLHIDPSFAALGGFDKPILHGLCTYGIATRLILKKFAGNCAENIKTIKARFAKPVLPGQTLSTKMWKENSRVFFETYVVETGKKCLTSGYVDLKAMESANGANNKLGTTLACDSAFAEMGKRLAEDPSVVQRVKGIFQWNILVGGKPANTWIVDLKNGNGDVYQGSIRSGKADTTLILEDADMMKLVTGDLNPQKAFMKGLLKIQGNVMLTQKLQSLLKSHSKL